MKRRHLSAGEADGKCYLALFDILGFQHRVECTPFRQLVADFSSQGSLARGIETAARIGGMQHAVSRYKPNPCYSLRFSDSILLYTQDATERSLVSLVAASSGLLGGALVEGIPLRGAITMGDLHVGADRQTFLGEGLVRAYRLEQRQDWIGAVLDGERISLAEPRSMTAEIVRDLWTIPYAAPMKEGPVSILPCLNWVPPVLMMGTILEDTLRRTPGAEDWRVERKIQNTLLFAETASQAWSARFGLPLSPVRRPRQRPGGAVSPDANTLPY